jgi:hypothetical protein
LLIADNPTDLCLSCHRTDNGNSWGMDPLIPGPIHGGGQFVFLLEDNINDAPDEGDPLNYIPGSRAGHSVISLQEGTTPDPDWVTSPGGSYPSSNLHCTSCHDPHGRSGHFRLLYGSDRPDAVVNGQTFTYTRPAPDAVGIPLTAGQRQQQLCEKCHGSRMPGSEPTQGPGGLEPNN